MRLERNVKKYIKWMTEKRKKITKFKKVKCVGEISMAIVENDNEEKSYMLKYVESEELGTEEYSTFKMCNCMNVKVSSSCSMLVKC